jgi:amphi-Trp domain-containing protein
MSDVQRNEKELVSRRQAAERLVDLAYALTTGGRLELTVEGERVTLPLADELRLERNLTSKADLVELKLELSWSPADAAAPPTSSARTTQLPSSSRMTATRTTH